MSLNSKTPFIIKNNKGSAMLIVSLVIGLLILAAGGYFGYKWYQNKLLQERIAKVEKIQKTLEDAGKKTKDLGESFDLNKANSYRNTLSEIDSIIEDLDKLETDKEIKDQVKKCIDNTKKITELARKTISVAERATSIQNRAKSIRTEGEAMSLQQEMVSLESDMKRIDSDSKEIDKESCKEAIKDVNDLIETLKEEK